MKIFHRPAVVMPQDIRRPKWARLKIRQLSSRSTPTRLPRKLHRLRKRPLRRARRLRRKRSQKGTTRTGFRFQASQAWSRVLTLRIRESLIREDFRAARKSKILTQGKFF